MNPNPTEGLSPERALNEPDDPWAAPDTGERMHIGELSRRSGRSVDTLRYYEREGLIPRVERDSGGRRLYNPLHVPWLALLDRLRATGMPIRSMRAYAALVEAGDATLNERIILLSAHKADVKRRLAELEDAMGHIDRKLRWYRRLVRDGGAGPKTP